MLRSKHRKYYIFCCAVWAVAVASKFKFHGLVFGFDYGNYQPDGKFYTYMALDFLNHNPANSAQQVVDWYLKNGFKMNTFTIQDLMPQTSYAYPVISHRILYPLLSVPFVALFGIPGMLVIPAISLLALFMSIQLLANKFNKSLVGLGIILILASSSTVMRWMMVNCTDALLVGLFSFLPLLLCHQFQKKSSAIVGIGLLIVLTSATRFVLPFWICIIFTLYFHDRKRISYLFLLLLSALSAIPALKAQISTALLPGETDSSTLTKIYQLPISFVKVFIIDFLEFGVLDRIFLIFIFITAIQSIRLYRRLSAQLFAASLFAGYVIGAINGTLGVNFRYQIPVLIFAAWALLDSLEITGSGLRLTPAINGNVVIDKAQ